MRSFDLSGFRSAKEIQPELDLISDAYTRLFTDRVLERRHPGRDLSRTARHIGFGLISHVHLDSRHGVWIGYEIPSWEVTRDELHLTEDLLGDRKPSEVTGSDHSEPSHEDLDLILDEAEVFIDIVMRPQLGPSVNAWWNRDRV